MKTITTTLYKFDELPAEAQEKAVSKYSNINVEYDWWDSIYDDSWNINLKITEFGLDHRYDIKGSLIYDALDTATIIRANHREETDTFQLANQYIKDYNKILDKYCDTRNTDDIESDKFYDFEEEIAPYEEQFEVDLLNCYWRMLRDEYNYLTSEEQIKETLIANEYDFTIEREIY